MNLQDFCCQCDDKPWLNKPFTVGGHTFATDRRIIVRVPAIADIPEDAEATERSAKVRAVFDEDGFGEARRLPAFKPRKDEPCEECKGTGRTGWIRCDTCGDRTLLGGQTIRCMECDGVGRVLKDYRRDGAFVEIGGQRISAKYYEILSQLPGIIIQPNVKEPDLGPLRFTFNGGDGLLMSLKKE